MNEEIYMIELDGNRYQVKVEGLTRMVFFDNQWNSISDFVDWLADTKQYSQLSELALLGMKQN